MRFNTPAFTRQLLMGLLYSIVFLLALYMYMQASTDKSNFFKASRECLLSNVDVNSDLEKQWSYFPYYVNKCAPQNRLMVQGFSNTDELKYHVLPTNDVPNMDCTIVSLGIGKDVEAEKSMQAAMPNCEFWGADPVNETNADIFPEVGKFYNIAVGAENGTFRSYVLEDIYRYQEVKYVDIATFLRNYVKRPVLDQLMIDIEHAEYPMLPFLLMDGQLARDKILICQMNIEVHRPNPEQLKQFFDFFQQLMKEKQWTLMSASSIIGHLRLFMINHGSEECHKRYIGALYQRDDLDVTDPKS
uniref:Methyltransf_21 domain-containing protein n=1 Tax=Haemonchus contortus TaxID=6289 RepID=A0A7I4XW71_HAECO